MHPGLFGQGLIDCFLENGIISLKGSSSAIMMRSIIHTARRSCPRGSEALFVAQIVGEILLVRVPNAGLFKPSHRLGTDKMSFGYEYDVR